MQTTEREEHHAAPVRSGRFDGLIAVGLVALAVGVSVNTALQLRGGDRILLVLPIALFGASIVGLLAVRRFEYFVYTALVIRASLDVGKLASSGTGSLDPSSMLAVVFIFSSLAWLSAQRRVNGPPPKSPIRGIILFFFISWGVSIVGSHLPGQSFLEWVRIGAVLMMFFVLDRLLTDVAAIKRLYTAIYLSSAIPVLLAFYGAVFGGFSEEKGSFLRIKSTFQQSNGFSRYLMILIISGVAIYRHVSPAKKPVMALLLGCWTVCILLTYTRSGWVACFIGLLVVGMLQSRALLFGLLVTSMVAVLAVPGVASRFSDLSSTSTSAIAEGNTSDSSNSLIWRFEYWSEVFALANSNPITGIGLKVTQFETEEAKQPHNDFLRAYVETGVLGFIAYVLLLFGLIAASRRQLKMVRRDCFERSIIVGFAGNAVALMFVSVVANVISQVVLLWYFFAIAAAANAAARIGSRSDQPRTLETTWS